MITAFLGIIVEKAIIIGDVFDAKEVVDTKYEMKDDPISSQKPAKQSGSSIPTTKPPAIIAPSREELIKRQNSQKGIRLIQKAENLLMRHVNIKGPFRPRKKRDDIADGFRVLVQADKIDPSSQASEIFKDWQRHYSFMWNKKNKRIYGVIKLD